MLKTFLSTSLGLVLLFGAISQATAASGPVQCQYFEGTTFAIDGDLAEWPAGSLILDDITVANKVDPPAGISWPDPNPLYSVDIYTAWDANYLYIAYDVTDPDAGLKTEDHPSFVGNRFVKDMLRVYFEMDNDDTLEIGADSGEFTWDIMASQSNDSYNISYMTVNASLAVASAFGADSANYANSANGTLVANVSSDGAGQYIVEARLAWQDLADRLAPASMPFTMPANGTVWGYDFLFIDDTPIQDHVDNTTGYEGGGQFTLHSLHAPATWSKVTFVGSPGGQVVTPPADANLHLQNPGFDDQSPISFLLSGSAGTVTSGSEIPGWRQVALGHDATNYDEGTVSVVAEATAPSAPNVVQIDKTQAASPSQFNLDRANDRVALVPGNVYRVSVFARDIDSTPENVNVHSPLFLAADGAFAGLFGGDATIETNDEWQLVAGQFTCPATVNGGYIETSPGQVAEAHYQMDEGGLYNVTAANRVINGDFENMAIGSSAGLGWFTSSAANNEMQAEIVADAASGSKAARFFRPVFTADSVYTTVNIPWTGSHQPFLKISVKDDPTIASGEYLNVTIPPFKADGAFQGVQRSFNVASGNGQFDTFVIDDLDFSDYPADTAFVQISLRIVDASGAPIPGDLIIDDVVLGDITAGYDTGINAVNNWTLY